MIELNEIHLSYGEKLIQPNDPLSKINIFQLMPLIKDNHPIKNKTQQLRLLYTTDPKSYNQEKKYLPYISGGIFHPPYRKLENFGYLRYFILDLDHLSNINKTPEEIKEMIRQDNRIIFAFTSPSSDGLKIIFLLENKCSNHHLYSTFYKNFATEFSKQYNLYQIVDPRTSDATRVCFICHDPSPLFNSDPNHIETIKIENYLHLTHHIFTPDKTTNKKEDNNTPPQTNLQHSSTDPHPSESIKETTTQSPFTKISDKPALDNEIMQFINQMLGEKKQKSPPAQETKAYITKKLAMIKPYIPNYLQQFKIQNITIKEISYALQISALIGNLKAEVNMFHGKKGFNIVLSTKTGTDFNANQTLKNVLENFLDERLPTIENEHRDENE